MGKLDGDVKIAVRLDSSNAEKGIDRVKQKMSSLAKTVAKTFSKTAHREDIENDTKLYEEGVKAAQRALAKERRTLLELKRLREKVEFDPEAREKVDKMGIEDLDASIGASSARVKELQNEINGYNTKIKESKIETKNLQYVLSKTEKAIKKLGDRMNQLARRVFIFNLLRRALESMRKGLVNLLSQDKAVVKSMAQIKGSLYAAFMPIYNWILPAIRILMNFLARLASAIASVVGTLFGVSSAALANASALNQQAGATGAAGNAAKKAAKSIAAFDEINQLNDESAGGSGGGAGGIGGMDFSGLDGVSSRMKNIAKLVLAIGGGIATWKLAQRFGVLKDAGLLRNIGFIASAAVTFGSIIDFVVPAIRDIAENGPNIENILKLIGGISGALAGISLMTGNIGGAIVWLAIAIAALAAGDIDAITGAFAAWDEKITEMIEDYPLLEKAYSGFKTIAGNILDAFREIAGIIVQLAENPMSIDVLGDIGDMSFTSKLTASVITAKLLAMIGKLLKLKGKIDVGKTGSVLLALQTGIQLATDVIDVAKGNVEDKTKEIEKLILEALFGGVAFLVTAIFGGGPYEMMITVPIGIKIGAKVADVLDYKSAYASTGFLDLMTRETIEAAQNMGELKAAIESITGLNITDGILVDLLGDGEFSALGETGDFMRDMRRSAENFIKTFKDKSGTEGFEEWLSNLGLLQKETKLTEEEIRKFEEGYKKYWDNINGAAEATEEAALSFDSLQKSGDAVDGLVVNTESIEESTGNLKINIEDTETALKKAATESEIMAAALSGGTDDAYKTMKTGAEETADVMTKTFELAAQRIRASMTNNLRDVFKSFSSGGTVFKGVQTGIESVFRTIVNGLIDGINSVMSKSFDKINTALDKIRNTQIDGSKPFIGVPRVSISKIPRLAQGAVIPANREFLAVLGDQKSGTNIEAPLDTIVEAVMIAMTKAGMDGGNIASAVKAALNGLSLKVGEKEIGYVVAGAINKNRREAGKLALNL